MPRPKKDGFPFSIRMDNEVHKRLVEFCEKTGLSKTKAIERAITMYIDDHDRKMKQLEQLQNN